MSGIAGEANQARDQLEQRLAVVAEWAGRYTGIESVELAAASAMARPSLRPGLTEEEFPAAGR